jgi:Peptidase C39 family
MSLLVASLLGPCLFCRASDMSVMGSTPSSQSGADQVWRQTVMCGPNSLYMLLALHDVPVDYQIIEKYIPPHREGMSLAELREASNTLGLRTEVRRCSTDELCHRFQSPVIAYVRAFNGGSQLNGTHYVVVIGITDDSITLLDGTTGKMGTFPRLWFNDFWLGYVLLPVSDQFTSFRILLTVSLCGWLLLAFWALKVATKPVVKLPTC